MMLKTCSFLSISVQFLLKKCKKVQKSANFCQFLPSFLAQKQISPIKSHFLLPPTTPFFKKTLKKPLFPNFSNLRQKDSIVFAVELGAFRTGGVEEIKFLQVPGLRVDIDLHLVYPLSDVLVRPFKDLG